MSSNFAVTQNTPSLTKGQFSDSSVSSDSFELNTDAKVWQHLSFLSGAVGDRFRHLLKVGKIDNLGHWMGEECSPPPLSASERACLYKKLDKAFPALQQVKDTCKETMGFSIHSFHLIGSYATHVLFGMPGLDGEPAYLIRLLKKMGIEMLLLEGFQDAYQKEPTDCDLRGHLAAEEEVSQNDFKNLFHHLQKVIDPMRQKLDNPFDSGIDRFGAIAIPDSIYEVIVYLNLKVQAVFSSDGLFIPLDSLMDNQSDGVVVPGTHFSSFAQVVIDHLLGVTRVLGQTGHSDKSHLQSLDPTALFRLWSGCLKGKIPADQNLETTLFAKTYAATFGHNCVSNPVKHLKSLCQKLTGKQGGKKLNVTSLLSQLSLLEQADNDCFPMAASIERVRSSLKSMNLDQQGVWVRKEMLSVLRSFFQQKEGFLAQMDNWLNKHHSDDPVDAFVYFFNAWSFLSHNLSLSQREAMFLKCQNWDRFKPLLSKQNLTFPAILAKLFFQENIPFEILNDVLHIICLLLDGQKMSKNKLLQVIRRDSGCKMVAYQLTLSLTSGRKCAFHVAFDPLGAFQRLSHFQAFKQPIFTKLESVLLPHLITFLSLEAEQEMSSKKSHFLKAFKVLDELMMSITNLQKHSSSLLSYLGVILGMQLAQMEKEELLSWVVDYLARIDGSNYKKEEIIPLLSIISDFVKGEVLLNSVIEGGISPVFKKEKLWVFLYSKKGINGFNVQKFVNFKIKSDAERICCFSKVIIEIKEKKNPVRFDGQILINLAKQLNYFMKTRSLYSLLNIKEIFLVRRALFYLIETIVPWRSKLAASLLQEVENERFLGKEKLSAKLWLKTIHYLNAKKFHSEALKSFYLQKDLLNTFFNRKDPLLVLITDLICSSSLDEERLALVHELAECIPNSIADQKRLSEALTPVYQRNSHLFLPLLGLTLADRKRIISGYIFDALQQKEYVRACALMLEETNHLKTTEYQSCLIGLIELKKMQEAISLFKIGNQILSEKNRARILIVLVKTLAQIDPCIDDKIIKNFFITLNAQLVKQLKKREIHAVCLALIYLLKKVTVFETSDLAKYKKQIETLIFLILPLCSKLKYLHLLVKEVYFKGLQCPSNLKALSQSLRALQYALHHGESNLQDNIGVLQMLQKNRQIHHQSLKKQVFSIKRTLIIACVDKKFSINYACSILEELCASQLTPEQKTALPPLLLSLAKTLIDLGHPRSAFDLLVSSRQYFSKDDTAFSDFTWKSLHQIIKELDPPGQAAFIKDHAEIATCFDDSLKFQELIEKVFLSLSIDQLKLAVSFARIYFFQLFLAENHIFLKEKEELFFRCLLKLCSSSSNVRSYVMERTKSIIKRFSTQKYRLKLLFCLLKKRVPPSDKNLLFFDEQIRNEMKIISQIENQISILIEANITCHFEEVDSSISSLLTQGENFLTELNFLHRITIRAIDLMLNSKKERWKVVGLKQLDLLLNANIDLLTREDIYFLAFNKLFRDYKGNVSLCRKLLSVAFVSPLKKSNKERFLRLVNHLDFKKICSLEFSDEKADFNLQIGLFLSLLLDLTITHLNVEKLKENIDPEPRVVSLMEGALSFMTKAVKKTFPPTKEIDLVYEMLIFNLFTSRYLIPSKHCRVAFISKGVVVTFKFMNILLKHAFKSWQQFSLLPETIFLIFLECSKLDHNNQCFQHFFDFIVLLSYKDVQGNAFRKYSYWLLNNLLDDRICFKKKQRELLIDRYLNCLINAAKIGHPQIKELCMRLFSMLNILEIKGYSHSKMLNSIRSKFIRKTLEVESWHTSCCELDQKSAKQITIKARFLLKRGSIPTDYSDAIQMITEGERKLYEHFFLRPCYMLLFETIKNRLSDKKEFFLDQLSNLNNCMFNKFNINETMTDKSLRYAIPMIRLKLRFLIFHIILNPLERQKSNLDLATNALIRNALLLLYQIIKKDLSKNFFERCPNLLLYPLFKFMPFYAQFSQLEAYSNRPDLWDYSLLLQVPHQIFPSKMKSFSDTCCLLVQQWDWMLSVDFKDKRLDLTNLASIADTVEQSFHQALNSLKRKYMANQSSIT